jgi:hypothetical protein
MQGSNDGNYSQRHVQWRGILRSLSACGGGDGALHPATIYLALQRVEDGWLEEVLEMTFPPFPPTGLAMLDGSPVQSRCPLCAFRQPNPQANIKCRFVSCSSHMHSPYELQC